MLYFTKLSNTYSHGVSMGVKSFAPLQCVALQRHAKAGKLQHNDVYNPRYDTAATQRMTAEWKSYLLGCCMLGILYLCIVHHWTTSLTYRSSNVAAETTPEETLPCCFCIDLATPEPAVLQCLALCIQGNTQLLLNNRYSICSINLCWECICNMK